MTVRAIGLYFIHSALSLNNLVTNYSNLTLNFSILMKSANRNDRYRACTVRRWATTGCRQWAAGAILHVANSRSVPTVYNVGPTGGPMGLVIWEVVSSPAPKFATSPGSLGMNRSASDIITYYRWIGSRLFGFITIYANTALV